VADRALIEEKRLPTRGRSGDIGGSPIGRGEEARVRRFLIGVATVLLGASLAPAEADWRETLGEVLIAPEGPVREEMVERIVAVRPPWTDVVREIESMHFPDAPEKGAPVLRSINSIDGVERPWVLVVPEGYDPARPTPLLVILHGGVGRAEIVGDPIAYARDNEFLAIARDLGAIAAFPFGQAGATWWDDVGMSNIREIVRTVKREHNVDDDRVWMIGFSDGASGGFCHAMLDPSDYAAIVALNGHIGVASLDGGLSTYAPNTANTPIYAVTTFDDQLYPSARMRPTLDMARKAGGDIFCREIPGEHDFPYPSDELPGIIRFLDRHARDPFPSRIVWETATPKFGRCRWFAIDRVTVEEAAPWYTDYNAAMIDDRVTIGFQPDDEYEGEGVRIGLVVEGEGHPAEDMGLLAGDTIIAGNGRPIVDMEELGEFKATLARGDSFELTVLRGGAEMVIPGRVLEPSNYLVFKRDAPSALARVSYSANRVDVEASRVGAFRVFVHPEMIRIEENLVVRVSGDVVFDAPVEPNVRYLLSNFLENRDRRLLYVAEVAVEFP
jgi:dienelactone hydrolase